MLLASTLQKLFKRCKLSTVYYNGVMWNFAVDLNLLLKMYGEAKRSMENSLELLELEDDLELLKEEDTEVGTVEIVEIRVVVDAGEVKVENFVDTEVTVEVVLTVVVPLGFTTVEVVLTVETLPAAVDADVTVRMEVLDATVAVDVTVRVVPVV